MTETNRVRFGQKCITEGCDHDAEWNTPFVATAEGGMCMPCWTNVQNGQPALHGRATPTDDEKLVYFDHYETVVLVCRFSGCHWHRETEWAAFEKDDASGHSENSRIFLAHFNEVHGGEGVNRD